MSLLPLPSRLPARKHVMAVVFGLVGVGLMAAAVLTASGLGSPFRASGPESIRTGAVLVDEPTTTTAVGQSRAVPPLPGGVVVPVTTTKGTQSSTPRTSPSAPPTTSKSGGTTTTTLPLPTTTVPNLLGGLGRGLGGGR
ncbi:MAG: hypothetical protein QOJ09_2222 [Actinomycetota bacterium]|jgi:hypothetical protein|nr:hypothetical protein [Actinomycetota bacterium]